MNIGFDAFDLAATKGVVDDLETLDTRSLPAALAIFALVVGCLPMVIIPLGVMTCATLIAFSVTGAIAQHHPIPSFAPSVMTTITISICFDYSLFLCCRYIEARSKKSLSPTTSTSNCRLLAWHRRSNCARVLDTISGAGSTVVVSSVTLLCCFCGLLAFPSGLVSGVGIALAVGLTASAAVSMTLVPAMLHLVGEQLCTIQNAAIDYFCRAFRSRPRGPLEEEGAVEILDTHGVSPQHAEGSESVLVDSSPDDFSDSSSDGVEDDDAHEKRSLSFRLARILWDDRRIAVAVVTLVSVSCLPLAWCIFQPGISTSANPVGLAPSPSPPERTLQRLETNFGAGMMAQFSILFESSNSFDAAYLNATEELLQRLAGSDDVIFSLSRLGSRELHFADYVDCLSSQNTSSPSARCASVGVVATSFLVDPRTSSHTTVSMARIALRRNPYSSRGFKWITRARRVLNEYPNEMFSHVSLSGSPAALMDVIDELYAAFPSVVGATLAVVFALLGLMFRSVSVALRSVLSLVLTLMFSFGSCIAVYVSNADSGPNSLSTRGAGPGIVWYCML